MHCESAPDEHVSDEVQPAMPAHEVHTSAVPEPFTYEPAAHEVHCESLAVVHVSDEVQPVTGLQGRHTLAPLEDER